MALVPSEPPETESVDDRPEQMAEELAVAKAGTIDKSLTVSVVLKQLVVLQTPCARTK